MDASKSKAEDDHDHKVWIMWHQAALFKMQRMPKMKDYLSNAAGRQKQKGIDEVQIKARMMKYQEKLNHGNGSQIIS